MRKLFAVLALVFVTVLIILLDRPLGSLPALGRLLDPINGAMASAESVDDDFSLEFSTSSLQQPVQVWFDDRLVPHIKAANDHDLYFVQGYIHAYFRLWQMDLQTRAAGGRVSEVLGKKALRFDREQRRKGMVFGAEKSLAAMEADPRTKQMLDAYKTGVNEYIASLNYRNLPIEYKLMGFEPEPWTNLKSALLLKYMADDLTGKTDDIALSILRERYTKEQFEDLFPERINGSTPVIPTGSIYSVPSMKQPAAPPDSLAWAHLDSADFVEQNEEGKGSNNWAVSGSRTASGAPILANDPHLGLNLPSLWFEVQLQAPGINVYGVSLPGAPGVVIGFNDHLSWGFTNNYRDVKDFYAVELKDDKSYLFNGKDVPLTIKDEVIKIKGKPDYIDHVKYTLHGPVIYDEEFHGPGGLKKPLALTWMAHKGTNEYLSIYLLNRATDYNSFVFAIQQFQCPGQNAIYADRQGNIALWGQGQFVNKWKEQGRFVMNGTDSSTLWKELIPMSENPHAMNPAQGFLSSANQSVTDGTYPYYYNGLFYEFRAWRINQVLGQLKKATVQDMFALQNDVYSILAANTLPVMLRHLDSSHVQGKQREYLNTLAGWDYRLAAKSKAASVFQIWSHFLYMAIWKDRFNKVPDNLMPSPERTMQLMQADTAIKGLRELATASFAQAADSLDKVDNDGLEWYKVKKPMVRHLTKLPAFSYLELPIGGWGNTPNAMKVDHGPSWRMVVQMGNEIEGYGVYPGGQSGNPGSKYYATFLDKWVKGEYYRLSFVPEGQTPDNKTVKHTWKIQPAK
ncbi:penicillin acylase family protein [Polluticoccus soli]|uniref:penicillin acylase family protein n=1 Tax=Polluticoccus soli TaxID=3034150 RepID=UPI0023E28D5F|nr:penicillin acylase family protein [Flavipsychrobacter sp. JY13-12]